ncbi:MAG: DJ-1/PfpI family protein [Cyanobacteria bacterium P01_G01_bin.39]
MTSVNIGFLVYADVVQLDIMGVYQILSFSSDAKLHLVAKSLNPLVSNEGLIITPTTTLDSCPKLDVICVPGGGMGQIEVMKDRDLLSFLQQQSSTAKYTTSVCTGSLILAAANLLQGYKATCHWAFREQLAILGVEVIPERIVIDRDRITGAGVTSGIDFGLTLLSLLWGEDLAKMAQLMMEYDPQPPFAAGTPETAGAEITESLLELGKPLIEAFWHQTKKLSTIKN